MPRCARCAAESDSRSRPWNVIVPPVGLTTPEIVLNNVDLPAPLGPTTVTNCPSETLSDTSVSARSPPYDTDRLETSSILSCQPLLAEIGLDHRSILHHRLRRAGREDRAMIEHDETVGHPHHGMHG